MLIEIGMRLCVYQICTIQYISSQQLNYVVIYSSASGVKAHRISFNIPPTATKNGKTAEVVVQEQSSQAQPPIADIDPLQVLL